MLNTNIASIYPTVAFYAADAHAFFKKNAQECNRLKSGNTLKQLQSFQQVEYVRLLCPELDNLKAVAFLRFKQTLSLLFLEMPGFEAEVQSTVLWHHLQKFYFAMSESS